MEQVCSDPAQRAQAQILPRVRCAPLCCGAQMMGKFRGEDTAELVNIGFNLPSCQHF